MIFATMSQSYEDYRKEYDEYLSRVRSFLASTRSVSTLTESERLLREAKRCAHAMQALAEVEGDAEAVRESKARIDREVRPLEWEVERAMAEKRGGALSNREELFGAVAGGDGDGSSPLLAFGGNGSGSAADDTERLIRDSESLLLESQALCAETEQTGAATLQTMGQQREQLYAASSHLEGTRNATDEARRLLREIRFRALRNKMFLHCVIVVLIIANGAVLYKLLEK